MGASKEEWEGAVTGDPGHFLGRDTGLVCHACPPHRLTRAIIKTLDRLARRALPLEDTPEHQQTGRRGEEYVSVPGNDDVSVLAKMEVDILFTSRPADAAKRMSTSIFARTDTSSLPGTSARRDEKVE